MSAICWQNDWRPVDRRWARDDAERLTREIALNLRHPLFGKDLSVVGHNDKHWDHILVRRPRSAVYAHVELTGYEEIRPAFPRCTFLRGIEAVNAFIAHWKNPELPPIATSGEQPFADELLEGVLVEFLTVNKYRVRLRDGQSITAVMPDAFIEAARERRIDAWAGIVTPGEQRIWVQLEPRRAPALPRIVRCRNAPLAG